MASTFFLKTTRRVSFWRLVKSAAMMVESISLAPKYAYLRCSDNGLSSYLDGSSIDWDLASTLSGSPKFLSCGWDDWLIDPTKQEAWSPQQKIL